MTSNYFPSPYEEFYVYQHRHPVTGVVFYIGHGSKGRAWTGQSNRSKEHADVLNSLSLSGFIPSDWVEILHRNLSKIEAASIERNLISVYKPVFNKLPGVKLLALTKDQLNEAQILRASGWSFQKLASRYKVSSMTIHRALAGKAVRYNDL